MIKRTPFQIQRAVIFALLMREIKTRFGGHWAGIIWLFGEPLVKLAMLTWMFIFIRGRAVHAGYPYEIYLLVAMLPFSLFSKLWIQLMNGIKSNAGLYGYKQVKPLDALVARTILEVMLSVLIFILCFLVLWRIGSRPTWPHDFLAYLTVVMIFVILGFGLGLMSAVALHFSPRISFIISLLSMPLQFLSGAIFPVSSMPKEVLAWLLLNPLLHLTELSRYAFLPGYVVIQGTNVFYPIYWIVVIWALGLSMYWVWRQRLAGSR